MSEEGAVTPIVLALLALAAACCLAVMDAGAVLLAGARARNAAEAAALAAAAEQWALTGAGSDPPAAALRMADAHGMQLDACECEIRGERARVTVSAEPVVRFLRVGPSRVGATAAAALDPGGLFAVGP